MMKTVALCMIVKNEQEYLRRCLDSVKDKVHQIIIVDTGSTDDTVSIAKEYTSDIVQIEWTNDFSAARNESIKHAKTDYILVLDADEYLGENFNLSEEIESGADYYFTKIYNVMSSDRGITHLAIRIFANNKGLHYRNRLHEHLNTMEHEDKLKAGYAKLTIFHTGYTDEMMESREKANRNLPLMLKEVEENPTVYNLFNMGRTYMWVGEHEKAIKYLQKAYPLSKELTIAPELISTLCRSLGELKRYQEALIILKEATAIYPGEVDLIHLQALFYMEINYYKDAIEKMNKCLEVGDRGITVTEGNGSYIAHFRLAEWYESRNDLVKSYEHILKAFKLKNDFVPVMGKYFKIIEKAGVPSEEVFSSTKQLYPISNGGQLEKLLEVMYQLRHPLLEKYLTEYNVTVQNNVMATARQYARDYDGAQALWLEMADVDEQNGEDILLLSIILKDETLFRKFKPLLNLSQKEIKKLYKIIMNEPSQDVKLTPHLENILERALIQLIRLQEFETFEMILDYLWQGGVNVKVKVCEHLVTYGFNEIAIDLLVKLFEIYPRNVRIIELLGDICLSSKYYQDAQLFYTKLLELCDDYDAYERAYELYERVDDQISKSSILEQIKLKFPLCAWVK
ncbi:UDP-N-acetylglucosamine-peptide N-acetylglucosaminyltransferase 110 kDa subunit [Paenibacillus polymyxa]|uniref:tetratricopeptide repeat-containing glycosyltransferase family 2 protein n=1 Tax=Paenibacillus polymyxa TaxID=1406 RepID=UPI000DA08ED1|nr:glycosyltransferase [Paenibacillus polymyxa]SPY23227.1 UDP-N-acetylglucosamine-peptide N-acetylglucosaminyltransferase 110 kDa subunit [Paenibacillus polymyxa]